MPLLPGHGTAVRNCTQGYGHGRARTGAGVTMLLLLKFSSSFYFQAKKR